MDHLLAKTKGRDGDFFKLLSNENIFDYPDNLRFEVDYNPDYKLEEDEWFAIKDFTDKDYCIDFLKQRFVSTEYEQLEIENYKKIDFICAYQTGIYYFQKLASSQIIRKKYFSMSEAPTLVKNEPIVIIDNYPDAIYRRDTNTLYFQRLTSIVDIFKGIIELYKEATQEEVETFIQNDFISLEDDYSSSRIKKANRKRIAMAMATLERYTPEQKSNIFTYIHGYCGDLNFDEAEGTFKISNEEDLKKLLFGIEQRYYTTIQGNEKRLANSIRTI